VLEKVEDEGASVGAQGGDGGFPMCPCLDVFTPRAPLPNPLETRANQMPLNSMAMWAFCLLKRKSEVVE